MHKDLDYPDVPFHHLLGAAAERWPQRTAIQFRDHDVTFGELDRDASRLAHALQAQGLIQGDRIALFLPNCPEYAVAFFGASRAGMVPTPLNPSYKEREVRHQLAESGAAAIICDQALWPTIDAVRSGLEELRLIVVRGDVAPSGSTTLDDLLAGQADMPPEVWIRPDDLAALPFSSGTTGLSKGVMLTQRNLVSNTYQFMDATRTTADDTLLIFLPLYHIYGVALMAFAIAAGARQILLDRFDLAEVLSLVERERVTQLYVVPPVMLALAGAPDVKPDQLRSLRFLMSAAAPLAPEVARRVADRFHVPVIQAYGMTETSPLTHIVSLDEPEMGIHSVGSVAADTRCRIVDLETGERELPVGEVGEVVLSGPQIMAGYWHAAEDTGRALRNGWLYSGDVGKVDEQGNLYIVDRKKEMIKFKAFSIAPAELEGLLLEHPAVADCAVTAQPDDEAGEIPRAYVVLRPGAAATPAELQSFVSERVASYKQIRQLELVDSIPRTPSGKILRRVLKEGARSSR